MHFYQININKHETQQVCYLQNGTDARQLNGLILGWVCTEDTISQLQC